MMGQGASHLCTNKELVRYTTRAMMLAAEYAKQQGLFSEANYALMKAHYQVCSLTAQDSAKISSLSPLLEG